MSNIVPYDDMQKMAAALGKGSMFGKTMDQLLPLMLIAQAEGKHPAIAAQEWDIIQGRPALKSTSALARFQNVGGKIQWNTRSDVKASATFSHPSGGTVEITWTIERAQKAGLTSKDNWKKFPSQMLAARVAAEGVRACFPAALSGFYVTEEVQDTPALHVVNIAEDAVEEIEDGDDTAFALNACTTLDELSTTWLAIPNDKRPKYTRVKDAMKEKLQGVQNAEVVD